MAVVGLIALVTPFGLGAKAAPGGPPISALAFRDRNADGQWQAAELPFTDLTVKAFDGAGRSAIGTLDQSTGRFTIPTSGLEGTRFRVEFSGLSDPYRWGATGTRTDTRVRQSGTSVQFVDQGGEAVVAVADPAEYCQDNPLLVTTCFVAGDNLGGAGAARQTVVSSRNDWGSSRRNPGLTGPETLDTWQVDQNGTPNDPPVQATARQTGAVWGNAWDRRTGTLYVASFLKMFSGFGPEGPNAIYRLKVDPVTGAPIGAPSLFARVGNSTGWDPATRTRTKAFTATGGTEAVPVCDDPHNKDLTGPTIEDAVYPLVYKCSFGDLELSPDGSRLFVTNLKSREVLEFTTADGRLAKRHAVPLDLIGECPTAEVNGAWPFGLGLNEGRLFVGGTCNGAAAWGNDARFWVLSMSLDGSGWRRDLVHNTRAFRNDSSRWFDAFDSNDPSNPGFYDYWKNRIDSTPAGAEAITGASDVQITDIEFYGDDLTLGMRGRSADQLGTRIPSGGRFISSVAGGDLVCAWWDAPNGRYQVEAGGKCGPGRQWAASIGGRAPSSYPNGGPGRGDQDPAGVGDEFYWGDGANEVNRGTNDPQNKPYHDEPVFGGLAQVNSGPLAFTGLNPPDALGGELLYTGGIGWADSVDGSTSKAYLIYDSGDPANMFNNTFFGKANGLGDLEALCSLAPVQIGNRVWNDDNLNGIQDPTESGIAGVTVRLYAKGGKQLADTLTNASGEYTFSSAGPDGIVNSVDDLFAAGDTVTVRVDNPADTTGRGPLAALVPSPADRDDGSTPTNDDQDSDAKVGNAAGVAASASRLADAPEITITTGSGGTNDHTLDLGFGGLRYTLGNRVWNDANDNGRIDTGESGIDGVTVTLLTDLDGDGNHTDVVAGTTTAGGGWYRFTDLRSRQYRVAVSVPAGMTTSTGGATEPAPGPDGDVDSDDNGTTDGTRVLSGVVTLADEREPNGETRAPGDTDATPDNRTNLSVDFGFHPLGSLGDRVFADQDNNGVNGPGEPGIDGIRVDLMGDPDGDGRHTDVLATQQTSGGGHYLFTGLLTGDYRVRLTPVDGYRSSTGGSSEPAPDPDTDTEDGDDNGTAEGAAVWSAPVRIDGASPTGEPATPGRLDTTPDPWSDRTIDFGLWRPVALGNRVWADANDNGRLDAGEQGVADVKVTALVDRDGDGRYTDEAATTTTDGSGVYRFEGLTPGRYVVATDLPAGTRSSTDATTSGNADNDVDEDDNGVGTGAGRVLSMPVTLAAGTEPANDGDTDASTNLTVDVGVFSPKAAVAIEKRTNGCLAGTASGERPPGSACPNDDGRNNPVVPIGSTVTWTYLVTNTGNVPLTDVAVTDDRVGMIDCGGSNVIARLAVGASSTCRSSGTATAGQYANTATVNARGETTPGAPPAALPPVTTVSHYFGGAPALTVKKYTNRTATVATGAVDDADAAGGPDPRLNHVVAPGTRMWWAYVVTNTGNLTVDGLTVTDDRVTGVTCPVTTLAPGASTTCTASGTLTTKGQYVNTSAATGSAGGTPLRATDPSHAFVAVPGIELFKSTNGVRTDDPAAAPRIAAGAAVTWTYLVRNTGNVTLAGVAVTDDREGPIACPATVLAPDDGRPGGPDEMTCSRTGVATAGPYRNVAVVSGTPSDPTGSPIPGFPPVRDDDPSRYTGEVSAIGDLVWDDLNANGVQDQGEPGIAGVTVILRGAPGATGAGVEVRRTTTDTAGRYLFDQLNPGTYSVAILPPAGWTPTTRGAGDDAADSDADPADGSMPATILDPGERDTTFDAGLYRGVSLGNLVFLDADNDGLAGPTEAGIDGVTVRLLAGATGEVTVATTTTSAGGHYLFRALPPGVYRVEITPPAGTRSSDTPGNEPAPSADDDPADGDDNGTASADRIRTAPVTLTGWEPLGEPATPGFPDATPDDRSNLTVDIGLYRPVTLGNRVYRDANDNGTLDPGERGVAGLTLDVLGDPERDGTVDTRITSVITDPSGGWSAGNLAPGPYRVLVALPEGHRSAADTPTTGTPDTNVDNDDSIGGLGGGAQATLTINLSSGAEPTGDETDPIGTMTVGPATSPGVDPSTDTNLTLDIGIVTPEPGLTLKKYTNGCDAEQATGETGPSDVCGQDDGRNNPVLAVGDTVVWTYVVRNTGNVPVTDIEVTDDMVDARQIDCGDGTNRIARLAVASTVTCTATGRAIEGQYANVGTVTGRGEVVAGRPAEPLSPTTDVSHYYGVVAGLRIKKFTNERDGDTPADRPRLDAGDLVEWTYEVTNTGRTRIDDIAVTDDREPTVICPELSLEAGASMVCGATGTAAPGPYENRGTVTGRSPDGTTHRSTDPSGYIGVDPTVDLWVTKEAGVLDADRRSVWTITVGNRGPDTAPAGTVLQDELPPELRLVDWTAPDGMICSPGLTTLDCVYDRPLAANATVVVSVTTELGPGVTQAVTNVASVAPSTGTDRNPADNRAAASVEPPRVEGVVQERFLAFTGSNAVLMAVGALLVSSGVVILLVRRRGRGRAG